MKYVRGRLRRLSHQSRGEIHPQPWTCCKLAVAALTRPATKSTFCQSFVVAGVTFAGIIYPPISIHAPAIQSQTISVITHLTGCSVVQWIVVIDLASVYNLHALIVGSRFAHTITIPNLIHVQIKTHPFCRKVDLLGLSLRKTSLRPKEGRHPCNVQAKSLRTLSSSHVTTK